MTLKIDWKLLVDVGIGVGSHPEPFLTLFRPAGPILTVKSNNNILEVALGIC